MNTGPAGAVMREAIFTAQDIKKTYENVDDLLVTKRIIQKYSTNRVDIRERALENLDLSFVREALDLGSGYGFFIEILGGRLRSDARITGLDLASGNEAAYRKTVSSLNYEASFISGPADQIRGMADGSFDLIIASYSLYFFPHLMGEIHRLLARGGIFIAVTHSSDALGEAIGFVRSCMRRMGLPAPAHTALGRLLAAFSLENGRSLLGAYFKSIEKISYRNSMVFGPEHVDDCIYYLEKKRNLIYKEALENHAERVTDLESCISASIFKHARERGRVVINKDDGIFICRKDGRVH